MMQNSSSSLPHVMNDNHHSNKSSPVCNGKFFALLIAINCFVAAITKTVIVSIHDESIASKEQKHRSVLQAADGEDKCCVCTSSSDDNNPYPNCDVPNPQLLGNGICSAGPYNTQECGFDGGDCDTFNSEYPNCDVLNPELVGNDDCDDGKYNTEECGFDGGDCRYPNCNVVVIAYLGYSLGDSICNSLANTEECGFDDGDCIEFNREYPNCAMFEHPTISSVGDGVCDTSYNNEECGYDSGDCEEINSLYPNCKAPFFKGHWKWRM